MDSKWVWILELLLMFVSFEGSLSDGCREEERVALLQLKNFFNGPYDYLSDWVEGEPNSNCCQWTHVKCNNNTDRVIGLNLGRTKHGDSREWYLNASLFYVFEELRDLDLSMNYIAGFVENEGLDKLSSLSNLEFLSLFDNKLKGTIDLQGLNFHNKLWWVDFSSNEIEKIIFPKGLDNQSRLGSLEFLDLSFNSLKGTIDLQSLESHNNLQVLNLMYNEIEKIIFPKGLESHNNLQLLDLSYNEIEKIIFPKDTFSSLRYLILYWNKLNEIINLQGLDNLEYLDLTANMLNNSILSSLGVLSSLKELDLSNNRLRGTVNISELHSLNNLESLDMSDNKIDKFIFPKDNIGLKNLSSIYLQNISIHDGSDLLQSLSSFPSLERLYLGRSNFSDTMTIGELSNFTITKNLKDVHMHDSNLGITFFQIIGMLTTSLEVLSLSSCRLQGTISNPDGGILAEFLYHQHNLQAIDLSHNNLTGEFPYWLLENNKNLDSLDLANNSLGGRFQLPTHSHMNLTSLDISKNYFDGHIPEDIGGYLPHLRALNLSKNDFYGSIPSSIGDMNLLETLDLSYNHFFGEIPEHLAKGCTSLEFLLLSNNTLHGKIFSSNFNLTRLQRLQLDDNNFTGKIPNSLSNASFLEGLYLSGNNLSGRIPSWLGNMSSLKDLIMPNNHFEGPIPSEFCNLQLLTILNIAENNLFGNLPHCFNWLPSITQVHLSKNKLQGTLENIFCNSSSLVTLDLSYNQLHGSIPTWIGRVSNLKYLILSNNNLSSEVPLQLCQLNQLQLIDLSHNNLTGQIPHCLDNTSLHDSGYLEYLYSIYIYDNGTTIQVRKDEVLEFTTKTFPYSYQGKVLSYMSGIDLSCNKLIGSIPQQVGNLTRIHTLNLSCNNLTGPIPLTFSKLKQIESLDLSYNKLSGKIPPQLVELNTLSSFRVAHNNLSGNTPGRIAQFSTFGEESYEGNPFLCGWPLNKSCDMIEPPPPMPKVPIDNEKDSEFINMETFYMSFIGSYIIMLLGIVAVLYINPYWRGAWFYLAETWMTSLYYFVVDNLYW